MTQQTQDVKISITLIKSSGQTALTNLDDSFNKGGGNRTSAYALDMVVFVVTWLPSGRHDYELLINFSTDWNKAVILNLQWSEG